MLTVGLTDCVPEEVDASTPMLWSIENEFAFVVVHDNVEVAFVPVNEVGFAESVQVGAGGGGGGVEPTVTVALQVDCPPGPVTVNVNVFVALVDVFTMPPATGETEPMPLSIDAPVDATAVHDRVVLPPPAGSEVGFALSVHDGTGGGGTDDTQTAAEHVAVSPFEFVTVPVYVVFALRAGVDVEPPAIGVTFPKPWSMTNLAAFFVVHVRTEVPPVVTEVGEAESVHVGAFGFSHRLTVTVAVHVTLPPEPVAVPVYVVVSVGLTEVEPEATGVTAPMLLSMEKPVALVVVHDKAEFSPLAIVSGFAESVQVGAGGGGGNAVTLTGAVQVTVSPAELVAVPVNVVSPLSAPELTEPPAIGVTLPILWSIANLTALVVVHVSFDEPPVVTFVGSAESVQVGF